MEKTKLGISAGILGALIYCTGLFSGYMITIIIAGYILIAEEDAWLRKTAVKAVMLLVAFSLIGVLIGLIPDLIEIIDNLLNIFGSYFSLPVINNLLYFIQSIVNLAKIVIFLLLAVLALSKKPVKIPGLDDMVDRMMG